MRPAWIFYQFWMAVGLHFGICGLTFYALRGSLGPSWDTLGSRPLKTSKRSLFGTSFLRPFGMTFALFLRMRFQCVFKTLADHLFHEFGTILKPLLNYMSPLSWKCWIPQKMHTLQCKITICDVLNAQLCLYFETCFNTKSRTHILLIFTRC